MTCSVAVFISSVLPLTDPSAELTSEMPPYTLPSSDTPSADRLVSFSVIVFDTAPDALLTKSIAVPPVAFSVAVFTVSMLPLTDPSEDLTSVTPPYTQPPSDTPSADRVVPFSVIVFDAAPAAPLTKTAEAPPVRVTEEAWLLLFSIVTVLPLTDPPEELISVMSPYTRPSFEAPSADRAVPFSVIVFDEVPAAPLTKTAEAPPVRVTEEFWVRPLFIVTTLLSEAPCRESTNVSELKMGSCPSGTDWAEPLADSFVPPKSKILLSAPSLPLTNVMEPPPAASADAFSLEL